MGSVLIALAFAVALPAMGSWGSSPSKECADKTWNGKYWKAEFKNSLKIKSIESNVSKSTISLKVDKKRETVNWSLKSGSDHALFRIYEKAGKHSDVNKGFWLPGDDGRLRVSKSLSHITFCFTDIPEPEISISKTTNGSDPIPDNPVSNFIAAGDRVEWKYVVKNTGSVDLRDIVVTDDREGRVGKHSGVLKPGKSLTFTKKGKAETSTYAVGYANLATVVAKSKLTGKSVKATDTSGYYGSAPSIALDVVGPDGPVLVGNEFTWSFTVENNGNVPLSSVVVRENGDTVGDCGLGDLNPGETANCTLTEIAELGQESSTFEARGIFDDGVTKNVVFETIAGVTFEINQPPTANPDTYETVERDLDGVVTLTVGAPGVLANDSDPDGDPFDATSAEFTTSQGASVTLADDGSFTYMPSLKTDEEWESIGSSYEDLWTYTVNDSRGGSAEGTVTVTVSRQLCVEESVESPADETVFASFTLTAFDGCKDFPTLEVEAAEVSLDGTVLFQPPTQDDNGEYRGSLTVTGVAIDFSDLDAVVLRYDTTPGGEVEEFELVPGCAGDSADPVLPGEATTGWCFHGIDFELTDGLWDITWHIYGIDDPKFVFK